MAETSLILYDATGTVTVVRSAVTEPMHQDFGLCVYQHFVDRVCTRSAQRSAALQNSPDAVSGRKHLQMF